MKDIDEELSAKIRTVFEDFDDGLSDQGWAALREKYPEKSRKMLPMWWISGVAACFLIALGWLLIGSPKPTQNDEFVTLNKPNESIKHPSGQTDQPLLSKQPHNPTEKIENNETKAIAPNEIRERKVPIIKSSEPENVLASIKLDPEKITITEVGNASLTTNPEGQQTAAVLQTGIARADQINGTKGEASVGSVSPATKKTTEQFLSEQNKLAGVTNKSNESRSGNTKSSFEVFTGTFLNYSGSNDVKVNAGFGLNANIKVSKSVFLAVGAGVSQNKTAFENQNTVSQNMASSAPIYNDAGVIYTSQPFVTDAKLSAQLVAIDLPITVKFYPTKKQNFYIATGINSNTYLNQQYTYSYNIVTPSAIYRAPQPAEEVETGNLGGFDFANSAIFAIGINQNIGDHKLIFEPYFKPAIGTMGDKNLRINTIGINLRFSFSDSAKK